MYFVHSNNSNENDILTDEMAMICACLMGV